MKTRNLLSLFVLIIFLFSCKKDIPQKNNIYKFKSYINYTTSGIVSKTAQIQVNLAKNISGWKANEVLSSDVLSIQPNLSGSIKILNKHAFAFIPDESLQADTEYTVTVNLKKIFTNLPKAYEEYTFQFKTITPNVLIQTGVLQSYDTDYQYLEGTLKASDLINLDAAKKIIKASQKGDQKAILWDESYKQAKNFQFKIDSIQRFQDDTKLLIHWDANIINASNKGENTVAIPGKNQFKVLDIRLKNDDEEYISINFSDKLSKSQNFKGLVSVQNDNNPTFISNGNELKVFPSTKLQGSVLVSVFEGIKNASGYQLKNTIRETIAIAQVKPQIRALSNGVILPNSNNLAFNFEAINVSEVNVRIIKVFEDNVLQFLQEENLNSNDNYSIKKVGRRIAKQTITLVEDKAQYQQKWKAYSIDISKLITVDPGAIYRVELSFNQNQVLYDCNEENTIDPSAETDDFNNLNDEADQEKKEALYWDNQLYSYKNYSYNWRQRDNPCNSAYYNEDRVVTQNLLASNLGIIAKKGNDNTYFFAITNLLDATAQPAATIQLYNYQQQEIARGTSNKEGFAIITTDKHAAFAVVSKGNNKGYVKLFDGNALSLSKFDVSGTKTHQGLKGYIYGERGVWRPGDTIHLSFILNDADNKLPKNHPVSLTVTNPKGKLIYRDLQRQSIGNFYKFTLATGNEAPTGNYTAKINVGGAKFYKTLKVETVKPNRLKIKVDFTDEILTSEEPIQGSLDVKWLHGTPAKNLKANIKAKVSAANFVFKNYDGYVFTDPSRTYTSEEINIFEGQLNEQGQAKITNNLKVGKEAPGMLNVQFLVRAFENGGDFSIDAFRKMYAPYKTFVGLKSPEGNQYGSYYTDENQTFAVATVNQKGKPIANQHLEVAVYQIQWRWWWSSSYDNLSKYISSSYHKPYQTLAIKTDKNGKANFTLTIPDEDRGRFLIRVIDKKGNHATGRTAYFYKNWWGNSDASTKDAAKMLVFSADKEKYNVGETAKIRFPSGAKGKALISIENGTKVLQTKWVDTQKSTTTVDVLVTKEMAPNVYVNISLLQPHKVSENDLPIRLFGVTPILVKDDATILKPKISMPNELKPEEEFSVRISEENNKPMTYTLAIVEEGLLDLTRFKTPDAYQTFYAREALGVKTWDIFDDVMGAYSGSIDQVFAIGGDGAVAKGKNKKANRFKPVVKFLGPFTLQNGQEKTHQIKLPNYIGAVRAMVVAGNVQQEAFGSASKTVPVKKPLMVLTSLPRKLSPTEKVTLPVTVFAMDKKVKEVQVEVKTSKGISVLNANTKTITFDKPDEKMTYFQLAVNDGKGSEKITVTATGGGEKATYSIDLNVFNPNPITTKIKDDVVKGQQTKNLNFNTFGVAGSNQALVELSTIPNINFSGRLAYLIQYPHGCVEQTTSSVFPQLYLADIFDLSSAKKEETQKNITAGIQRLGFFQKANGGFSYWMGENEINDWGTNYAGHFLLEAERKGFVLPITFKTNFIKYQKQAARSWRPRSNAYTTDLTQAYRLYTLALAGSPDLSAMNRLRAYKNISNEAVWRLAAAYALVGQKEAASELLDKATYIFEGTNAYNYGSIARNKAMVLETLLLNDQETKTLAKEIAKELSSKTWMSTQTTAYCLLSIGKMVVKNGGKSMRFTLSMNGKTEEINTSNALIQRKVPLQNGLNKVRIINLENNVLFTRIINSGKVKLGQEIEQNRGLNVNVAYKDLQGKSLAVNTLKQGQDFVAEITVSNPRNTNVNDVALTQIFPSGWEIVNTRFTDYGTTVKSQARYTDIKDDRVNFYFDIQKKRNTVDKKTFTVLLNAAYLGTYYLPGVQVEAMYDNDYFVRKKGSWVNVVK